MKATRWLTLALGALTVCAPASAGQIGTAGGLLHSPPTITGGIVASGPAIERTFPGVRPTSIPFVRSPPIGGLSSVVPFGVQPFPTITNFPVQPFQPIQPINTFFPVVNTFGPSLAVFPQGYGVFTDGLGRRTFIPRGSALLGNRGYGFEDARRHPGDTPDPGHPPPPPAPAPVQAPPAPVAAAPEPERRAPSPIPSNPSELDSDATLEGLLRQEIEDRPDLRASVVLYDVVGRRKAEYHSSGEYYPSSIVRLPVLIGTARELSRGALDPKHRIELAPPADDSLSRRMGDYVSVTELLQRMIRRGDLTAANALIDHVGFATINEAVSAVDLQDTVLGRRFNDPNTSPTQVPNRMPTVDAATLLYKLLRRDMPERGMAARVLDLLSRQTTTHGIPRLLRDRPGTQLWGLSASARLKSGREVANDVSIVTASGHAYVLAIYTDAPTDSSAWIGELALRMHDALSQHRAGASD